MGCNVAIGVRSTIFLLPTFCALLPNRRTLQPAVGPVLHISPSVARRFHRRAVLLDAPAPNVAAVLAHHGYVQIDPINVCGRMHDLIARNRVAGYHEGDLMRHLHGDDVPLMPHQRVAFEHHLPSTGILVAFGLEAWPHLQAEMRARTKRSSAWSGRLSKRETALAEGILAEMRERGPLNSDAFNDGRRAKSVWGKATLAKSTLQKMFFHGRVLISRREGNRRFYDLPERVLPSSVLASPEPSKKETARWSVLLKLRQRRLVPLKRAELPLVEDQVQPVQIPDCPLLYCLRDDLPLLDAAASNPATSSASMHLLAPLDPLIYDRVVTSRLWGFDYTWEVYTPPQKRVRGYYALPLLAGHEIVGHVDPKAERSLRKLTVISRRIRRGHSAKGELARLAIFLGLRDC